MFFSLLLAPCAKRQAGVQATTKRRRPFEQRRFFMIYLIAGASITFQKVSRKNRFAMGLERPLHHIA